MKAGIENLERNLVACRVLSACGRFACAVNWQKVVCRLLQFCQGSCPRPKVSINQDWIVLLFYRLNSTYLCTTCIKYHSTCNTEAPETQRGNISGRFNSDRKKYETKKIKSFSRWKKVLLEKFFLCVCDISCAWRKVTSTWRTMFVFSFREHGVAVNFTVS